MTRLIDADALKYNFGEINDGENKWWDLYVTNEVIAHQPTVDAEPVRHGKWIESDEYDEYRGRLYRCSNCNTFVISDMDNYCPYCGAKMGVENDNS